MKKKGRIIPPKSLSQCLKFGIIGISNTLVSLMVYYVFIYLSFHYIAANTMGFIVSVLNAYYWNNRFVFQNKKSNGMFFILAKVFIVYGMTFLLNTSFLFIMVHILHISVYVAPVVNVFLWTPVNFLLNKYWAFH